MNYWKTNNLNILPINDIDNFNELKGININKTTTYKDSKLAIDNIFESIYNVDLTVNLATIIINKTNNLVEHLNEIINFLLDSTKNSNLNYNILNLIKFKIFIYLTEPQFNILHNSFGDNMFKFKKFIKINKTNVNNTIFNVPVYMLNEYLIKIKFDKDLKLLELPNTQSIASQPFTFNTQSSYQPFNTQSNTQPFNTQSNTQPFNAFTQPNTQPFNTQPFNAFTQSNTQQPFNTQSNTQPFNTQSNTQQPFNIFNTQPNNTQPTFSFNNQSATQSTNKTTQPFASQSSFNTQPFSFNNIESNKKRVDTFSNPFNQFK